MTTATLIRALRNFNRRRPFQKYYIEFVSGDRSVVNHPELVRDFGELFLYRGPHRSNRVFDASSVCQLIDPGTQELGI